MPERCTVDFAALIQPLAVVQSHLRGRLRFAPPPGEGPPRGSGPIPPKLWAQFRNQEFELEHVPYALGAAWNSVCELNALHGEVLARFDGADSIPSATIRSLEPQIANRMSYAVDSYLEGARRCQNAVVPYIGRTLKLTLPASLADLVADLEKGRVSLPAILGKIVSEYWSASGLQVKRYRDVSQHHAIVSSDAKVQRDPTGRLMIHLVLPNNPEATRPSSYSYTRPAIHALKFCHDSFFELLDFVYEVLYVLARTLGWPHGLNFSFGFRAPASPEFEGALPLPMEHLQANLADELHGLAEATSKKYGRLPDPPLESEPPT